MENNFFYSILNILDVCCDFYANFFNVAFIQLDAPSPWGIYFQDSATPQCEGLVELHNINLINICTVFIIVIILSDSLIISLIKNFEILNFILNNCSHEARMIYLNKKLIKVNNNSNFLFRTYSTNAKDLTKNILNPLFITGFADAEGIIHSSNQKEKNKKKR